MTASSAREPSLNEAAINRHRPLACLASTLNSTGASCIEDGDGHGSEFFDPTRPIDGSDLCPSVIEDKRIKLGIRNDRNCIIIIVHNYGLSQKNDPWSLSWIMLQGQSPFAAKYI